LGSEISKTEGIITVTLQMVAKGIIHFKSNMNIGIVAPAHNDLKVVWMNRPKAYRDVTGSFVMNLNLGS